MIRVLHFIPGFLYGGIEAMFLSWYRHIDKNEISFELLLRSQDDDASALVQYREMGGIYYRLPPLVPSTVFSFKAAVDSFFRVHHDYDILHIHSETPFIITSAKKYGIPKIVVHSHTSASDAGFRSHLKRFLYSLDTVPARNRYADRAFACSDLAAQWKFGGLTFKGKPVEIIHNAIEAGKFDYNEAVRNTVRQELGADGLFVIGHVGRLTFQKNQFFLLDIVKAYSAQHPDTVLWMAGDGPDEEALRQYAAKLGIESKVRFLGVRADIPQLLQGMDCFLLPSRNEGLPVTLVEAQTSGLPCLISDTVTRQVDITDCIYRLSLTAPPERWGEQLARIRSAYVRSGKLQAVTAAGFEIKSATSKLVMLYTKLLEASE